MLGIWVSKRDKYSYTEKASMDNVIDLNAYRVQQKKEEVALAYYDMFNFAFDIYLHYFVYPIVAAVITAHQKRIVKLRH